MPRRRTLTARIERDRNRVAMRRNVNTNDARDFNNLVDNDDDLIHILEDSYKIAFVSIPRHFDGHECGLMNLRCMSCFAKHFKFEITGGDSDIFTSCCHKGKVRLPELGQVEFFKLLYDGLISNDRLTQQLSKNYFENIRQYNSAFAMISSEAQVADTILHGVYHFKIHDVFYHRAGSLSVPYGDSPRYAQLYFYDTDTAVTHRMHQLSNQSCDSGLMRRIAESLQTINPFVRSFMTMRDICNQHENAEKEISMFINVDRELDIRRYNDVTRTDVAVIFSTTDGEPPFERNMVAGLPKVTRSPLF